MKKKILSLMFAAILSTSLMVGCGDNDDSTNETTNTNEVTSDNNKDNSKDNDKNDETENKVEEENTNSNTNSTATSEEKVQAKFEEAIKTIYNTDYTDETKAMKSEEYIKANFTPEGAEEMINKIISYKSPVSESDLLVTLVKEVENSDDRFSAMYEVRYNVTVTFDKPSIYSDLISVIFVDKDGEIVIESLNENNF